MEKEAKHDEGRPDWVALHRTVRDTLRRRAPSAEVEDLAQETLLRLHRRALVGTPVEDWRKLARAIATNVARAWHRESYERPPLLSLAEDAVAPARSGSIALQATWLRSELAPALRSRLSSRQAEALDAIVSGEVSVKGVARRLGVYPHDARRLLRVIAAKARSLLANSSPPDH